VATGSHHTDYGDDGMTDAIIRRIERFAFPQGAVCVDSSSQCECVAR